MAGMLWFNLYLMSSLEAKKMCPVDSPSGRLRVAQGKQYLRAVFPLGKLEFIQVFCPSTESALNLFKPCSLLFLFCTYTRVFFFS